MIASMASARPSLQIFRSTQSLAQPARGQPGIGIVRTSGEMQMQGKDADDVADAVRHHLVDDALALIERDEAGGDDTAGFGETRMRDDGGGRGFRR